MDLRELDNRLVKLMATANELIGKRVRVEVLEPNLNPAGWDDNAIREQIGQKAEQ